jgi:NAD+ synthase
MESINDLLRIPNLEKSVTMLCDFIKDEVTNKFQKSGATIGVSGGIDSAVAAALCAKALGPSNVLGVILPEKESDPTSQVHAKKLVEQLKIKSEIIDITPILESAGVYRYKEEIIKNKFSKFNDKCRYRLVVPPKLKNVIGVPFLEILDENNDLHKLKISVSEFLTLTAATSIKHRIRMTLLYFHGEKNNKCVIGTTNKSEYMQGYFVKYGDGGSDIEPLVNLYKLQVYQLGNFLKVPHEILNKDASPDVWSFGTTDEEFFYSVPYDVVDLMIYAQENNLSNTEIQRLSKLSLEEIENLLKIHHQKQVKSQHMREIPHGWIPDFT